LCVKNELPNSQESVELRITPKTMLSSPLPLSVHGVYTFDTFLTIFFTF
jgi:hypothetical protein